jgi:GDP-4-dehydro-6-deoxy-D-mannose reductase
MTRAAMSQADARRILITGSGGFVGHWLLQALIPELDPADRVILAGPEASAPLDRLEAVELDVADAMAVDAAIAIVRPTHVLHMAAIANVQEARADRKRTWDVNFGGTYALAEAVLRHAREARFVFVSTSEIYGDQFNLVGQALDETARLEPTNPYAASKAAADLLVGQLCRDGLKGARIRPFNHTGPRQSNQFVIPAFAAQIAAIERGRQPAVIKVGNLEAQRDFLDVRDVVRAYVDILLGSRTLEPGLVLNLASGKPRRIGDVLDALLGMATVKITVSEDPSRMRPSDTPIAVGNASRAAERLGWRPLVAWNDTLTDVLAYWRGQNP